ncbi:hypothetical protein BpHYR1_017596 [Brachionus plicatilis]|uniref:Uncharacterized protein n=1 Tax=Brachionus plicatilis TaxID=10195 RepID=A0A3M7SDR4_BRAPC|nr:hypothetical protein BpHYR1_017596 [Brachionus plicatilis]
MYLLNFDLIIREADFFKGLPFQHKKITRLVYKSHQSYDLHKNFYQYLLYLEQMKEFFHNLVTLTDHMGQD